MSERNFGKFDPRGIPGKINSWVHQPVDVKKRDLLIAAGVGVPAGLTLAYLGFSNSEVYAGPPTTPTGELPIVKGFEAPIRVVDELDGKELLIYNSQTRLREDPEIADNVLIELVDAGTIAEVVPPKDTKLISTDPKKPHTTVEGDGYVWSSVKLISGADTGEQGFSANSAGGKLLLSPIPLESVPDDVRSQFQHIEEISIPAALKAVNITEIFDTTNIGGGGESLEIKIMNLWGDETRQETRTVTNGGYKYINGVKTWIPAVTETIDVIATTHDVNTSPLKAWQRAVGIGYIEATNQIDETKIGDDGSFEMKNIAGLKPEGNIVINVSIIGDTTRILSRAGDVFIVTDIEIDEKNKESVKIGAVDWNALSTLFDPDRVSEIVSNMTDLGGEDPDGLLAEIGGLNEMSKVFFPVEGGVFLPKVDVTLANDLLGLSGNDAMTAQSFGDVDYAYDPESGEMTANFNQITFFATQEGNVWSWEEKEVPINLEQDFLAGNFEPVGGLLSIEVGGGQMGYLLPGYSDFRSDLVIDAKGKPINLTSHSSEENRKMLIAVILGFDKTEGTITIGTYDIDRKPIINHIKVLAPDMPVNVISYDESQGQTAEGARIANPSGSISGSYVGDSDELEELIFDNLGELAMFNLPVVDYSDTILKGAPMEYKNAFKIVAVPRVNDNNALLIGEQTEGSGYATGIQIWD